MLKVRKTEQQKIMSKLRNPPSMPSHVSRILVAVVMCLVGILILLSAPLWWLTSKLAEKLEEREAASLGLLCDLRV